MKRNQRLFLLIVSLSINSDPAASASASEAGLSFRTGNLPWKPASVSEAGHYLVRAGLCLNLVEYSIILASYLSLGLPKPVFT